MATLLTTAAMHPALRVRVDRAVSPRARARFHASRAGLVRSMITGRPKLGRARLLVFALMMVLGALGYASHRAERRAVAAERATLAGALAAERARLPAGHQGFVAAIDRWLIDVARAPDPI